MVSDTTRTETAARDNFAAGGTALAKLARGLLDASTFEELERAFSSRFGQLVTAPMYGSAR